MKKKQKKLALKKKTISQLSKSQLSKEQMNQVRGGHTCHTLCGQYGYNCLYP